MSAQDLMIVALHRVTLSDLLFRFPDLTERYDTVVDRRARTRRRAEMAPPYGERRLGERRRLDVTEGLRSAGWAIVPAALRAVTAT